MTRFALVFALLVLATAALAAPLPAETDACVEDCGTDCCSVDCAVCVCCALGARAAAGEGASDESPAWLDAEEGVATRERLPRDVLHVPRPAPVG